MKSKVSLGFATYKLVTGFQPSLALCSLALSLAASPLSAQTDCSEPGALDWLVGEWSVEGHDDFRVSWREAASINGPETDVLPYLTGRGYLPVEVNYEVQIEGDNIYLSRVEASSSSRNLLSRCSENYWLFGDNGGDLIARSGERLLALMSVPDDEERASAPAGVTVYAAGVTLVRREVDGAGNLVIPTETSSAVTRQRSELSNTIREATISARTE